MKILGGLIGLIVLLVLGVGAYLFLYSGDLLKSGIEEFGPQFLGADVSVGQVDLDLAGGSAGVKRLEVGNPQGFSGDYAIKLNEIAVTLDASATTAELIVIKHMLIDGASLHAVAQGKNTNLQRLMDNLEQASGSSSTEEPETPSGQEMKFIVDRFTFSNADASLVSDLLGETQLDLPDISLAGVGRKSNGATASELVQQLMRPISKAVSTAAVQQGLDLEGVKAGVMDKVKDKLGGSLKGLTDRLNR